VTEQTKAAEQTKPTSGTKSGTTTQSEAAPKEASDMDKVIVTDEGGTQYIPAGMKTVSPEQVEGLTGAGTSTAAQSAGSEKPHNTTVSAEYVPPKEGEPQSLGTLVENIPDMSKTPEEQEEAAEKNNGGPAAKADKKDDE